MFGGHEEAEERRRLQQTSFMCDVCVCLAVTCAACLSNLNGRSHLAEADQHTLVAEKMKSNNKITQSLWAKEVIMVLLSL